ncbi:MAG: AAA family ATPase, partial [Actinobacteria bacterium]|nr:AAA family ATPase [Actinomycetota bacterium]
MTTCPSCGARNPDGARFCNSCGGPLAGEERAHGEERKVVTVVFADLVGFTAQAERLDPEDVREFLSPYHARLRGELERFGGTVEKFIGDAVMAVFGAPAAHEDDPERAVRAALAIRDWASEQPELDVRVAVNTGEALVSIGARAAEGEAMVAGDVVNTAARLQAAAPVNGILVGETTYRATRDAVAYRNAEPVRAKGKAEEIRVWEAVETVASVGIDVVQRATTPLVGRERELDLLGSLLNRVREESSAQLVTIVGVPGMGKSRLVAELYRLVDSDAELISWRQGRCLPYGESVTFWALGEIVKAEAGILETDAADETEQKLRKAVTSLVTDETESRWLEAELRALVGLRGDELHVGGSDSATATAAWRRFLEALAERRPVVLVFEDLHWADDGLLDFLDDAVDWLRRVPILFVATARPELLERRQGWGGGKANSTTISLQPLAQEDALRLVSALLEKPLQLAEEQQALLDRAGGNPLFAEQYVRMLQERGTTGELPESVQGVIAARLDALPRVEKELLHEAAVHGKVFSSGAVAEAAGASPGEAEQLLRALERKDFVRRERRSAEANDTQYSFQHVLLRDVAYGQIPRRARADKHRRAAEWIETLGRPDDHAELLAHHYKQALELARAAGAEDDPKLVERTRDSMRAAGERALALSAYAAAADFFADALALTPPDDPVRPRLLLSRGRALMPLGPSDSDALVEALDAFREKGDVEGVAEAATLAARFAWFAGNRAETDRFIALALEAVVDRPDSRARAAALTNQSGFLMLAGRYEESIRLGEEALPLVEALGMDEQRARLHIVVGTALVPLGDPAGIDQIKQGIAVAEAAANLEMPTTGYANLASLYHYLGKLDDAREAWRRQLDLTERYGLGRFLRDARAGGAGWDYLDGRWDDALASADELIAASEAGDAHYTDALMLSLRAWIRLARGDEGAADHDSAEAVEMARASDAQAQVAAFTTRAAIAMERADRQEAEELASELAQFGPVVVSAVCWPFPTLAEVAWVFRDLGREDELRAAVLDPTPYTSPWVEAAGAIAAGELVRAAHVIEAIGHTAAAAHARLRAAE